MPKYTMEIGQELDAVLTVLAANKGTTKAEIIRRAVATYRYLQLEPPMCPPNSYKVSITTMDDHVVKDVILP